MQTTQMGINGGYFLRVCSSKGASHYHGYWAETLRQAGEWESLRVKRGRLQVCSARRWLPWGSWRLHNQKRGLFKWFAGRTHLAFCGWSWVGSRDKHREAATTDQVLTVSGLIATAVVAALPGQAAADVGVARVLLLPAVCLYIVSRFPKFLIFSLMAYDFASYLRTPLLPCRHEDIILYFLLKML